MHFCLTMYSILSHWQLKGRAGVRTWPRHPGRGLLFMPFQAYFVLTSKAKLSLFQVSGLPISTFRSWRDSCVTVYFFLFFFKEILQFCGQETWHLSHILIMLVPFDLTVLLSQTVQLPTFSEFYVTGAILLPHSFHSRYFIWTTQSQKGLLFLRAVSCLV